MAAAASAAALSAAAGRPHPRPAPNPRAGPRAASRAAPLPLCRQPLLLPPLPAPGSRRPRALPAAPSCGLRRPSDDSPRGVHADPRTVVSFVLQAFKTRDETALDELVTSHGVGRGEALSRPGPLGKFAWALDPPARRILPGHSSAETLSFLETDPGRRFVARVQATSAATGEAAVFEVVLRRIPAAGSGGGPAAVSLGVAGGGAWRVHTVRLDGDPAPNSPEVMVSRFLAGLQKGDLMSAFACIQSGPNDFLDHPNMSRAGLSTYNPRGPASRGDGDGTPLERFEALMASPAYSLLVEHESSLTISVDLPSERETLIQVLVKGDEKLEMEREEKRSQGWSTAFGESAEVAEGGLPLAARFAFRACFAEEEGGWRVSQMRRIENVQVGRE